VNDAPVAGFGKALSFDGTNDHVNVPDSSSLDLTTTYTIETWIKPDSASLTGAVGLVSKDTNTRSYALILANGKVESYFSTDGTSFSGDLTGTTVLTAGQWYHIAATRSGSTMTLYINGTQEAQLTTAPTANINTNTDPVVIGARKATLGYFSGQIDDVRIWSAARTQAQIQAAMTKPLKGNETNLAGYWNFENGTGTVATDRSTNANKGTLTNFALSGTTSNWVDGAIAVKATTNEDTQVAVTIGGSDVDNNGSTQPNAVTPKIASLPTHGKLYQTPDGTTLGAQIAAGDLVLKNSQAFNKLIYVPDANYNGADSFTYQAYDFITASANTETVNITVNAVNDAPMLSATASNATFSRGNGAVSLYSGTSIDTIESGQAVQTLKMTMSNVTDGANEVLNIDGSAVTLTDGNSVTTATNGMPAAVTLNTTTHIATVTISKTGGVSVAAAQTLVDGLTYQNNSASPTAANRVAKLTLIQDTGGTANNGHDSTTLNVSDTTQVAANAAPVAANDSASASQEKAVAIDVLGNDTDANGDTLSVSTFTQGANGTVALAGGKLVYTPRFNFVGSDHFQYTVSDGNGGTDTGTVNITVKRARADIVDNFPQNERHAEGGLNVMVVKNGKPARTDVTGRVLESQNNTEYVRAAVEGKTTGQNGREYVRETVNASLDVNGRAQQMLQSGPVATRPVAVERQQPGGIAGGATHNAQPDAGSATHETTRPGSPGQTTEHGASTPAGGEATAPRSLSAQIAAEARRFELQRQNFLQTIRDAVSILGG